MAYIGKEISPTDLHNWGYHVLVVDVAIQLYRIGTQNQSPRARARIYLGHSPSHVCSVLLVLHLQTAHVSP